MKYQAIILISLTVFWPSRCHSSPEQMAISPTQCFVIHMEPGGSSELLIAMNHVATTNNFSIESSPGQVSYLRQDGSIAGLIIFGLEDEAIITSYDGKGTPLNLNSGISGAKNFRSTPCPPTSSDFSPPTIYGEKP